MTDPFLLLPLGEGRATIQELRQPGLIGFTCLEQLERIVSPSLAKLLAHFCVERSKARWIRRSLERFEVQLGQIHPIAIEARDQALHAL